MTKIRRVSQVWWDAPENETLKTDNIIFFVYPGATVGESNKYDLYLGTKKVAGDVDGLLGRDNVWTGSNNFRGGLTTNTFTARQVADFMDLTTFRDYTYFNSNINMENNSKVTGLGDGTKDGDAVNLKQLKERDTKISALETKTDLTNTAVGDLSNALGNTDTNLADLTTVVESLKGAYVIIGSIGTANPTPAQLSAYVQNKVGRPPRLGDVVIDSDGNEWYFDDTGNWDNLGQSIIAMATTLTAGIVYLSAATKQSQMTDSDKAITERALRAIINDGVELGVGSSALGSFGVSEVRNRQTKTNLQLTAGDHDYEDPSRDVYIVLDYENNRVLLNKTPLEGLADATVDSGATTFKQHKVVLDALDLDATV